MIWIARQVEATAIPSVVASDTPISKARNNMAHTVNSSKSKLIKTSMALEATKMLEALHGINRSNKTTQRVRDGQSTEIARVTITSSIAIQTNMKKKRGVKTQTERRKSNKNTNQDSRNS